jgi:hypothetical protein
MLLLPVGRCKFSSKLMGMGRDDAHLQSSVMSASALSSLRSFRCNVRIGTIITRNATHSRHADLSLSKVESTWCLSYLPSTGGAGTVGTSILTSNTILTWKRVGCLRRRRGSAADNELPMTMTIYLIKRRYNEFTTRVLPWLYGGIAWGSKSTYSSSRFEPSARTI